MAFGTPPSYLSKNDYSYCFRIRVPLELQTTVSRKELRYSLRTGNLSAAKMKARYLAGQFQLLFRYLQRRKMDLTKEQVDKIIKDHKERLFELYESPVPYGSNDGKLPPESEAEAEYWWMHYTRREFQDRIIARDYAEIEPKADELLNNIGLPSAEINKKSPEYYRLCAGLMWAEVKALDRYEEIMTGKSAGQFDELFNDAPQAQHVALDTTSNEPTPAHQTPLLSEFVERFPETKPKWDTASKNAYKSATKVALKILGDIPVGTLTRQTLVNYRETLAKIPAFWINRHPNVKVEDLPAPGLPTISNSTFDRTLGYMGQLMDYAVDCGYLPDSPMPKTGMSLPEEDKEVHLFNDDQVKTVIAATQEFNDHRYWIPLLGLYTGCRANELCQLHKEDLKDKNGIWFLDINDDGKKTLKNKDSKRLVPLHSVIVELGFIDYVQSVNHHRIFPKCKYRESTGKYANNFGQWFNRLLVKTDIKPQGDRSITFHSFRHRAYTSLKRLGIDNEHIDRIMGHSLSETKNPTYHHGYLLSDLKIDIDELPDHRTL